MHRRKKGEIVTFLFPVYTGELKRGGERGRKGDTFKSVSGKAMHKKGDRHRMNKIAIKETPKNDLRDFFSKNWLEFDGRFGYMFMEV